MKFISDFSLLKVIHIWLAANVLALGEEADFEAQNFLSAQL